MSIFHTSKYRKSVASHFYLFTINCQVQAKYSVERGQDNKSNGLVGNCEETTVAYFRYYFSVFPDVPRPEDLDSLRQRWSQESQHKKHEYANILLDYVHYLRCICFLYTRLDVLGSKYAYILFNLFRISGNGWDQHSDVLVSTPVQDRIRSLAKFRRSALILSKNSSRNT